MIGWYGFAFGAFAAKAGGLAKGKAGFAAARFGAKASFGIGAALASFWCK